MLFCVAITRHRSFICRVARLFGKLYNAYMAKKSSAKLSKNVIIAVIAIILILAVALTVIYFAAPSVFDRIAAFFTQSNENKGENPGGGSALQRGEGDLQIHFVDVGQGDCILILFPDGKDMLIDCGTTKGGDLDTTLSYISAYVTDGQIDYLMITHGDRDHVEYVDEIIETYDIDNIFMPNVKSLPSGTASSNKYQEQIATLDKDKVALFKDPDTLSSNVYAEFFIAALTEPDCNVYLNVDPDESTNSIVITDDGLETPENPDTDATYRLTFYCPTQEYYDTTNLGSAEKKNAISPIGVLEYNDFRIVLTGDSNEINEPVFVDRVGDYVDCDVLKVGHHGSETSSTAEFLKCIDCEYAVISCGEGNTHKHPRQATLDRLVAEDMTIYRTDNNGNIVLTVNESIVFTVEKEVSQEVNRQGLTGDKE